MPHYRITTRNAVFNVHTDEDEIIIGDSYTAPIAKNWHGKDIKYLFELGRIVKYERMDR